jgi:SpoVK/Ycf46/Vps4 family AAA+-type ATPase
MSTEMEKRVVATVLGQLDRIATAHQVVVLAATNRINSLDAALRRPGRFDREIEIGVPSERDREAIFNVYLRQLQHSLSDSQIRAVAASTHGYVGADIAAVCKGLCVCVCVCVCVLDHAQISTT